MNFHELKLTERLPSPAGVGLVVLKLSQDESAGMDDLISVISTDPSLTGRLIKLANSSLMTGVREVTTARDAVLRLGLRTTTSVSLGFTLVSGNRSGSCTAFPYDAYWAECLATAAAAGWLATNQGARFVPTPNPAEAFTCGLVTDIGRLALASAHSESYSKLLERSAGMDRATLIGQERELFATDRRQLAGAILRDWKLPEFFALAGEWAFAELDLLQSEPANLQPSARSMLRLMDLARCIGGALLWRLEDGPAAALYHARRVARFVQSMNYSGENLRDFWSQAAAQYKEWSGLMQLEVRAVARLGELSTQAELARNAPSGEGAAAPRPAASPNHPSVAPAKAPPQSATGSAASTPMQSIEEPSAPSPVLQILIVSPEDNLAAEIRAQLAASGHALRQVPDCAQALQAAVASAPQVILCDARLDTARVIALARSLRSSPAQGRMHLVLLAGPERNACVVQAFDAGFDEVLQLPLQAGALPARMRAVARAASLDRELELQRKQSETALAQLAVLARKLELASITDPLTELPNRRHAMDRLRQEFQGARASDKPLSLLMIDIDRFKQVNDTYGHDAGDAVLQGTARVLRRSLRRMDLVCRLGGEEFVVLCPGADAGIGMRIAERLRTAVEGETITYGQTSLRVTISTGVATLQPGDATPEDALRRADKSMYAAKQAGRNRSLALGQAA